MATPIDYVCVRAEHNRMLFPARAVYVVHEGRWAYCPAGATGAHEWISAGGANLQALNRVGVRVPVAHGPMERGTSGLAERRESRKGERPARPPPIPADVIRSD